MYRFVIVLSNKGYWNPRGWMRRGSILILHFWRKLCSHPLPSLRIFTRAQCSPLSALINCSSYPTASLITRRTNPSNIPTLLGSNSLLETLPCLSSNLVPFSSLLLEEIKRYSRLFIPDEIIEKQSRVFFIREKNSCYSIAGDACQNYMEIQIK